ncbi:hypothetical protein PR202_ga05901 [Eleusine coracana subsp. coracana]|uniref:F-box domain-containing protein n=1 Tax=Eleusine coracana subsp. coracana TaxID=191504 RepID=A0AAV5BV77_ELECO|nr:hypothetical protein PR202_ga05901 [Eleusine coracana subsp. coracana]
MTICNKRRTLVASGGVQVLPEEIMVEVFLPLPIKSILRFRAVCRSWAAVLSSEEFCSLHMAKVEATSALPKLFFTSSTASFDATAVYLGSSSGPGDGLLFTLNDICGDFVDMTHAQCRGLTLVYDAVAPAYHVFNAATRAVTQLPPCQSVAFATAGLGFDARMKNHKEKLPPVFADGFLHWLVDPVSAVQRPQTAILSFSVTDETLRLGRNSERAIVSFNIALEQFDVVPCPSCIVLWNSKNHFPAFVVELEGILCAVLANPAAEKLGIWKLEHGQWERAYIIYLKGWSGYSLETNVVVPWAVDPKDGRILLNIGRKVGLYDPARRSIETLYDLDEVLQNSVRKHCTWKPPLQQLGVFDDSSPAFSGKNFSYSRATQSFIDAPDPYVIRGPGELPLCEQTKVFEAIASH